MAVPVIINPAANSTRAAAQMERVRRLEPAPELHLTEGIGHARELAKWSREAVVVASDIPVHLPRRHRLVRDKAAGEQALMVCGKERLLLVVSRFEVRRAPNGSTIAEIKVDFLGATCDGQSERFSNTVSIGTGSSSQGDASTCS